MTTEEEKRIVRSFSSKYVFNSLYQPYFHGCGIVSRKYAAERNLLPQGESIEGLCMMVDGNPDKLPADLPKPENHFEGILVVYDKESKPAQTYLDPFGN